MELPSCSNSEDSRKLYVGLLTGDMTEDEIRDYFANKFGEVKDLVLLKDKATGERCDYGFVEFLDPGSAAAALKEMEHEIAGKKVIVNKARRQLRNYQSAEHQQLPPGVDVNNYNVHSNNGNPSKFKIFVGGISSSTSEEELKSYFKQFGNITDAVLMYDRETGRPRGFGFVTYDSEDAFNKVMQYTHYKLKDKLVEVKPAVPKKENNSSFVAHSDSNYDSDRGKGKQLIDDNHCGQCGHFLENVPRYGWHNHISTYPLVPQFDYGTCSYGGGCSFGGYGDFFNPWVPYIGSEMMMTYGNAAMYTSYPHPGINGYMVGIGGYGHHGAPDNDKLIEGVNNLQITEDEEADKEADEETTAVESVKSDTHIL